MNCIIRYNTNKGFILCESDAVKKLYNGDEKHLWIPEKSGINECFKNGVKDYILNPKENGYQSLHATFRRPNGGECFEVQIRTFDMHVYAETGSADHEKYKRNKYETEKTKSDINFFEKTKIHMPGYGISPEGRVFDYIGLEKSLQILQRQKTF